MSRLTIILLIAVLLSALYLVRTQYASRALTTELDHAMSEARRLEIENDRLDVERRAQATPKRVEKDRKSTRLNSSHSQQSRMPSSA